MTSYVLVYLLELHLHIQKVISSNGHTIAYPS